MGNMNVSLLHIFFGISYVMVIKMCIRINYVAFKGKYHLIIIQPAVSISKEKVTVVELLPPIIINISMFSIYVFEENMFYAYENIG